MRTVTLIEARMMDLHNAVGSLGYRANIAIQAARTAKWSIKRLTETLNELAKAHPELWEEEEG